MSETLGARTAFIRSAVSVIGFLVVTGWSLSFVHRLYWLNILGAVALALGMFAARWWAGSTANLLAGLREPLAYWPFLLVSAFALVAAVAYPITMLDSLSYRMPRILFWLQEDSIYHIASPNTRMNYMP